MKINKENLKEVILPFGATIYQTKNGQSISSDTAAFVEKILESSINHNLKVLELGSGNGIISIMLSHYRKKWNILGLEIQSELTGLSQQNKESANVSCDFLNMDLKEFESVDLYDIIVSNPPYFPKEMGRISPDEERAVSRHEIKCDMMDILRFIRQFLKNDGKAYLMYPEYRLNDLITNTKKVDLFVANTFFLETGNKKQDNNGGNCPCFNLKILD